MIGVPTSFHPCQIFTLHQGRGRQLIPKVPLEGLEEPPKHSFSDEPMIYMLALDLVIFTDLD
jgi:hypothetical protein